MWRLLTREALRGCRHGGRKVSSRQVHGASLNSQRLRPFAFAAAAATVGAVAVTFQLTRSKPARAETLSKGSKKVKTYSASEVSAHNSLKNGVWVTYGDDVYDVTEFVESHPGGMDKILLAAGSALEPFWSLYAVHDSDEVREILSEYRIGRLDDASIAAKKAQASTDSNDPYAKDPARHPLLHPNTRKPFNAEPPPALLADEFLTPNELFFVRNHLPVPTVDPETYFLEVVAPGREAVRFTLNDLKTKFPKHKVVATLQCAGNRRSEMTAVKPVKGLSWGTAAISNAEWAGARLTDVLAHCGITANEAAVEHMQFEGLDRGVEGKPYGASVPFRTAMDPHREVVLAYEMNGVELPADHGYPIRVVIPGTVGARNVKWLSRIVASHEESHSHWQRNDYKGFSPSVDWDTVDFTKAPAIQDLPITSAICLPRPDSVIPAGEESITVSGYAWSGGGRGIVRVDVSLDGGRTWQVAEIKERPSEHAQRDGQEWAWSLWEAQVDIPTELQASGKRLEVVCKAVDTSYNNQPDSVGPIWNLRGVLNNSWHRVTVTVT